jgi:hypothetical protein
MKNLFILILLLSSFLTACTEDQEPGLPAATTEGLNTAGCYLDGKLWMAKDGSYNFSNLQKIDGGLNGLSRKLFFWMWMTDRTNKSSITIYLDGMPKVGKVYECNTSTNPTPAYCEFINYCEYSGPEGYFMTNEDATGTITFTKADSNSYIYSGTYQFTGLDKRTGKRITITQGRFDYKQFDW